MCEHAVDALYNNNPYNRMLLDEVCITDEPLNGARGRQKLSARPVRTVTTDHLNQKTYSNVARTLFREAYLNLILSDYHTTGVALYHPPD